MTSVSLTDRDLTPPVLARLAQLRHAGDLTEADAPGMTLIRTSHGAEGTPEHIELVLALDRTGMIRQGRFRSAAAGSLLAVYDAMVALCIDRPLAAAPTITPRQAAEHLRGDAPEPALTLGEDADQPFYVLRKAAQRLSAPATASAAAQATWTDCGLFEKVRRIETVLDAQVRPALASDGGGIDLVDLKGDDLWVQYQGACGSCSSSIGGTLQFVQDSLNNHLGTRLTVQVSAVDEAAPSLL
jgi:Fe-S cluster biogenesis protein NfuA/NifU-like protein involved in Fe-S cluster formation